MGYSYESTETEEFRFEEESSNQMVNWWFCLAVGSFIFACFTVYLVISLKKEVRLLEEEKKQDQTRSRRPNEPKMGSHESSYMTIRNGSRDRTRSTSPISVCSNPYLQEVERGQTPTRQDYRSTSGFGKLNDSTEETLKRPNTGGRLITLHNQNQESDLRRLRVSPFQDGASHRSSTPPLQPVRSSQSKESGIWAHNLARIGRGF